MQEKHVPIDSPDRETAELMVVTISFPVWEGISINTLGAFVRGAGVSFRNDTTTTGLTGGDTIGAIIVARDEAEKNTGLPVMIDAHIMSEAEAFRFERLIELDEKRVAGDV